MKRKQILPFDPKAFLAKVNGGRTVSEYRNNQIVYAQGGLRILFSTFRKAKPKKSFSPSRARKP